MNFDNNDYVITKDEAISIAKEYDKNITDMKIVETKVEKKYVDATTGEIIGGEILDGLESVY